MLMARLRPRRALSRCSSTTASSEPAGGAACAAAVAGAAAPRPTTPAALPCPRRRNPFVVGLALTYFFIYVVRQGVTSWFVFYLLQVRLMLFCVCVVKGQGRGGGTEQARLI